MTFRALAKRLRRALQSRRVRAFRKAVPLSGFVDDHTLLTKRGGAVVCLRHAGVDDECLPDEARERLSEQLCVAQRPLDGAERLYQYAIRRAGQPLVHQAVYENPKVQEVQDDRHRIWRKTRASARSSCTRRSSVRGIIGNRNPRRRCSRSEKRFARPFSRKPRSMPTILPTRSEPKY